MPDVFKKNIAILGSTGSIGTQTLELIKAHPENFSTEVITANDNYKLLIKQALKFKPNSVIIGNENYYNQVNEALKNTDIKVFAGYKSIVDIVESSEIDMVVSALVGFSGLEPTLNAIRHKKPIALANKETLVVAGEIVMKEAEKHKVPIIPIDSEHSAILQCIVGENHSSVDRIILTASGGPFRGKTLKDLENITVSDALIHPNWNMGKKVTIDSATLMNKGLEVIEAKWIFNIDVENIDVVVHPQSIIHSMIQFKDSSIKAQLGIPSMKIPILYAMSFPYRLKVDLPKFSFLENSNLTFEKPDLDTFRCLGLAYEAIRTGHTMPCIMNAANEIAVNAFLNNKIRFVDIPKVIEKCMNNHNLLIKDPQQEDFFVANKNTRIFAKNIIKLN